MALLRRLGKTKLQLQSLLLCLSALDLQRVRQSDLCLGWMGVLTVSLILACN